MSDRDDQRTDDGEASGRQGDINHDITLSVHQWMFKSNIDTIQIIDLNFLTKHNALDENQTFELLTTTFLGTSPPP